MNKVDGMKIGVMNRNKNTNLSGGSYCAFEEDESSDSDSDTGFDEYMESLRKACSVTGVDDSVDDPPKASTACRDFGDTYASEDEDIEEDPIAKT
ncbi:unnamed protein product [Lactuca virosa]|uniref:Uncharacterized protein n=1 Tax=Lactuca virosa TaxID=75947 RepID=A0AAU9MDE4_9ASTR|nr:unnamed protein product [Lactuca virosa]